MCRMRVFKPILCFYRRLDGTSNNKNHVRWGAAQEDVARDVPAMYADGIVMPAGSNRPSPRKISNELFQQVSFIQRPSNEVDG